MSQFQAILAQLSINTVPLHKIVPHEGVAGKLISFDSERFRTRNIHERHAKSEDLPVLTGNLAVDPHIYTQLGSFRIVMFIDPRWITTSTAFGRFRSSSGQSFAGFGRITKVDYENDLLSVTPLAIGIPQSLSDLLDDPKEATTTINEQGLLNSLVDLKRARMHDVHFASSPSYCDLCGKDLSEEKYMIDGAVKDSGGVWACMCAACFLRRGVRIAWGFGQLYLRDETGWLEVAGFPPEES
jgi:hypothetical protein